MARSEPPVTVNWNVMCGKPCLAGTRIQPHISLCAFGPLVGWHGKRGR